MRRRRIPIHLIRAFERVGIKTPTVPSARPGLLCWQGRCGFARYHWLNNLLALENIGKQCDLACSTFVRLGHYCVGPASPGCSGLASETITKAPQGQLLTQRPRGLFFLLPDAVALNGLPIALPSLRRYSRRGAVIIRLVP